MGALWLTKTTSAYISDRDRLIQRIVYRRIHLSEVFERNTPRAKFLWANIPVSEGIYKRIWLVRKVDERSKVL